METSKQNQAKVSTVSKPRYARLKALLPLIALTASMSIFPAIVGSNNQAAEAKALTTFRLPDMPFLPPYSGRIVAGDCSAKPQPDGGIAYNITFETAEQPAQVLAWYKSAFQLYSWNVENQDSAQFKLSAQHGKNVETNIFFLSPRKPGASVQVQLYYHYVGRDI